MSLRLDDSEKAELANGRILARRRLYCPTALFLCLLMAFSALNCLGPRNASADLETFWVDNFDGNFNANWSSRDLEPESYQDGEDTWGVVDYCWNTGLYNRVAWCAANGVQGTSGQANTAVHQYDDQMHAQMEIALPSLVGYSQVLLVFYFMVDTSTDRPNGWLDDPWEDELRLYTFYTAVGYWTQQWSTSGLLETWTYAHFVLTSTTTRIKFEFHADNDGYHGSDGAWIEGVRLDGEDTTPPTSQVGTLPVSSSDAVVQIPYTASDSGSDVQYVELWYMKGGSGLYSKYTYGSPGGTGRWTISPITFDSNQAGGAGRYYFYTIAVDNHDNREAVPANSYDRMMDINVLIPEFGSLLLIVAIVPAVIVVARRVTERGGSGKP